MTKQKELIDESEYEEVEDPDFFKFENVGDKVSGELVDIGTSDKYNFGLYTLEKPDGEQLRFHGSAHLDTRMKRIGIGDSVIVEYQDVEKKEKGEMKLFSVKLKKRA